VALWLMMGGWVTTASEWLASELMMATPCQGGIHFQARVPNGRICAVP
jgi:hypothetical protein